MGADNFTRLADFPDHGRKDHCGTLYNDKLYILGGISLQTKEFNNDLWEYDPATNKWQLLWHIDNLSSTFQVPIICFRL